MELPSLLLESLREIKGFNKDAFEKIHASGRQVTSIRFNPFKFSVSAEAFSEGEDWGEVLWADHCYYLNQRPSFTFDPLFHAGCYYVQEASSMFIEQALRQTVDLSKALKVLDLCASPGGKSTHIQSLISKDSLLVSNEVIRSRANVLKDNIIKWGCENVMVTNNDPKDFTKLENYFDVIVVDAPCSGSGLFRRDPDAIAEWSENNVQLCSQRQQRILADVWPALKKDGILVYSTCSYSKEEDEDIVNWLTQEFAIDHLPLTIDSHWGIVESSGGYRFWPDKVKGEGFFLACFKKKDGEEQRTGKIKREITALTNKEKVFVANWINPEGKCLLRHETTVYAWPARLKDDFSFLLNNLRVIYSGVEAGGLMRDKMIPCHALAMTNLINNAIPRVELTKEEAIQYLKKKELNREIINKGWQLVTYKGHSLGWINVLQGRINNYYPKELRILRDN
ncbi:MAG TPA: hypothetical protein VN451_07345 [Chitinophagaceae bacterium]|nr:hypothetical protein [Chitinophagaceae bacterium]